MMKIYTLINTEGSVFAHPVVNRNFDIINEFLNENLTCISIKDVKFEIIHNDRTVKLKNVDSPWFGSNTIILKKEAAVKINSSIQGQGKFHDINCDECELLIYKAKYILNALDENKSDIVRFKDGRIMHIKKHIFKIEMLDEIDIFRLSNLDNSCLYVTENFVKRWKSLRLSGIDFVLRYSDDLRT